MTTTIKIRRYFSDFANVQDGLRIVTTREASECGMHEDRDYALPDGVVMGEDQTGELRLYWGAEHGELCSPKRSAPMIVMFASIAPITLEQP